MSTHRDPDPYGWLSDRPRPIWQRINWWRLQFRPDVRRDAGSDLGNPGPDRLARVGLAALKETPDDDVPALRRR